MKPQHLEHRYGDGLLTSRPRTSGSIACAIAACFLVSVNQTAHASHPPVDGSATTQTCEEAVNDIKRRASLDDAEAQFEVALLLERGLAGQARDAATASRWYLKAAEQGIQGAQVNLGLLLLHQSPPDYRQARHWFEIAAQTGSGAAANNLGFLYSNGVGVTKNEDEAVRWYKRGALAGNPLSQFNLALVYWQKRNRMAAFAWMNLARRSAYIPAQIQFENMTHELTNQQKTDGEALSLRYQNQVRPNSARVIDSPHFLFSAACSTNGVTP